MSVARPPPPAMPARTAPWLVTMGDACGIGPELIAMLWRDGQLADTVVVADPQVMRRALHWVGASSSVACIDHPMDLPLVPRACLPIVRPNDLPADLVDAPVGRIDARAGAAAAACIRLAVDFALRGEASAIVTAPIHKASLAQAGVDFPGHTEMLQHLAARGGAVPPVRMMLANDELCCVLVTIHMSLRRAIDALSESLILDTVRIAHHSARQWGLVRPRIAVAGLNPHAGEGGLFGDEEIRLIAPAVRSAQAEGIDASGPHAPDTVFMRARHAPNHPGEFDIVVAMTHDHGLIPVKYLGVDHGVNVTLGLPFVRTSPDHGTAFDLAGTARADPASLRAACAMARRLASAR